MGTHPLGLLASPFARAGLIAGHGFAPRGTKQAHLDAWLCTGQRGHQDCACCARSQACHARAGRQVRCGQRAMRAGAGRDAGRPGLRPGLRPTCGGRCRRAGPGTAGAASPELPGRHACAAATAGRTGAVRACKAARPAGAAASSVGAVASPRCGRAAGSVSCSWIRLAALVLHSEQWSSTLACPTACQPRGPLPHRAGQLCGLQPATSAERVLRQACPAASWHASLPASAAHCSTALFHCAAHHPRSAGPAAWPVTAASHTRRARAQAGVSSSTLACLAAGLPCGPPPRSAGSAAWPVTAACHTCRACAQTAPALGAAATAAWACPDPARPGDAGLCVRRRAVAGQRSIGAASPPLPAPQACSAALTAGSVSVQPRAAKLCSKLWGMMWCTMDDP